MVPCSLVQRMVILGSPTASHENSAIPPSFTVNDLGSLLNDGTSEIADNKTLKSTFQKQNYFIYLFISY